MICQTCGKDIPDSAPVCPNCGTTTTLLSSSGTAEDKKSKAESYHNVLFGILIGVAILIILVAIAIPNFLTAATPSKIRRAKSDMKMIATAIEAYYIDAGVYPSPGRPSFREPGSYNIGEGSYAKEGGIIPIALTTPVAYMTALPHDPFHKNNRGYYGYGGGPGLTSADGKATIDDNDHDYSDIWPVYGWIITSYGPDVMDGNSGVYGVAPLHEELCWSDNYSMDTPDFMQCDKIHPLQTSGLTYDPTNGVTSAGDIWRRGP